MIPKDSVKWFEKQFLSTSHSFVHISHFVCVCLCYMFVFILYMHMWRPEVTIRWLSLLLSTLHF